MRLADLPVAPPASPRGDASMRVHGHTIAEPFRWTSEDTPKARAWLEAQQNAADAFFEAGGSAAVLRAWLTDFLNRPFVYHAFDAGPRRFLLIERPDAEGAQLAWRDRAGGPITTLPANTPGELLMQDCIFPSPDGAAIAFAVKAPEGDAA